MKKERLNVLRISTSGSVDDGKSTLIGRLLYDTHSLPEDKLRAIEESSQRKRLDFLDLSLATDGLIAEREQGITIDVAHIYFSTPKKSYIIADTPGHIEYTRNMITGASTSQVAIILIDARNGIVEQTKRHFFINDLLKTKEIIVAINKMDLVDYQEEKFIEIKTQFKTFVETSDFKERTIKFIPISAKFGDNVVKKSENMEWYRGKSILDYIESLKENTFREKGKARFQVQTVIRPKTESFHDFRGYAGKVKGGNLAVGDKVTILPSGTQSTIKKILFFDQYYDNATDGSSITLTLTDDVNLSRGDLIVKSEELPKESKQINAKICWMDKEPLQENNFYLLQHGIRSTKTKIKRIASKIDIANQGKTIETNKLEINDLGSVDLQLAQPLHFDPFNENKGNGTFILIDPKTNNTSGVGFIQ